MHVTASAFAHGSCIAGITGATNVVASYLGPGTSLRRGFQNMMPVDDGDVRIFVENYYFWRNWRLRPEIKAYAEADEESGKGGNWSRAYAEADGEGGKGICGAEEGRREVSLLLNVKRTCYGHDSPEVSPV